MPTIFRVQINKSTSGESWSNDWIIEDETIEDAQDTASGLIAFERSIHTTAVFFDYVRISTVLEGDRFFRHIALNSSGLSAAAERLPLYCTFRLDLPTANSDPCRKYFRAPVNEADQTNGFVNGDKLADLNSKVASGLATPGLFAKLRSGSGQAVISGSFTIQVQMRQLHRHKRKKVVVVP